MLYPTALHRPAFLVISKCTSAVLRASPYLTSVLAPPQVPVERVGPCSCRHLDGHPRSDEHVVTRDWQSLSCCQPLAKLLGSFPLQMRVYPSLQFVQEYILSQVKRQCKEAGFPRDIGVHVAQSVLTKLNPLLARWRASIPRFLQLCFLRPAVNQVHSAGFVFVQLDRNPQRLGLKCTAVFFSPLATSCLIAHLVVSAQTGKKGPSPP